MYTTSASGSWGWVGGGIGGFSGWEEMLVSFSLVVAIIQKVYFAPLFRGSSPSISLWKGTSVFNKHTQTLKGDE